MVVQLPDLGKKARNETHEVIDPSDQLLEVRVLVVAIAQIVTEAHQVGGTHAVDEMGQVVKHVLLVAGQPQFVLDGTRQRHEPVEQEKGFRLRQSQPVGVEVFVDVADAGLRETEEIRRQLITLVIAVLILDFADDLEMIAFRGQELFLPLVVVVQQGFANVDPHYGGDKIPVPLDTLVGLDDAGQRQAVGETLGP